MASGEKKLKSRYVFVCETTRLFVQASWYLRVKKGTVSLGLEKACKMWLIGVPEFVVLVCVFLIFT